MFASPFSRKNRLRPTPDACGDCLTTVRIGSAGFEELEGRTLMSAAPLLDLPPGILKSGDESKIAHHATKAISKALKHGANLNLGELVNISIGDIGKNVLKVDSETGNLVGQTTAKVETPIGTQSVPLTITLDRPAAATADGVAAAAATTSILHLELGPIDLNLLGLRVQTSRICLDITATSGPGNLLGNLLTGIANLLNGPNLNLGSITNLLNQILPINLGFNLTQIANQGGQLTALGNFVLGAGGASTTVPFTAPLGGAAGAVSAAAVTQILNLDLGPLDLNLLGLGVSLDNCNNGPVTVDVTAVTGPGNLLGNLLSGLLGILD